MIKGTNTIKKDTSMLSNAKKRLIFYILMIALPILQVIVFYFFVNFRSFTMAFQKSEIVNDRYVYQWTGLTNFKNFFTNFGPNDYMSLIRNSLSLSGLMLVFGLGFAIFFSYYIYKKNFLSGAFKVMLYLPHIVSGLIFVYIYKYFMDCAVPEIWKLLFHKEINPLIGSGFTPTKRTMILFFVIWLSFGTQVLLFTSAMSGISDSIIESASLDGVTPMRELVSIVIPSIYPTFVTFLLLRIVAVFTDQMRLFAFEEKSAHQSIQTIGYNLYLQTLKGEQYYPELSAMGMLFTIIAVPLTLVTKYLLEKFGPKTV